GREFAHQSNVGVMMTWTVGRLPDALTFLPDRAFSGGVDLDARFKSRYSLSGYWAASTVHGDPEAIEDLQQNSRHYYQRPDAGSFSFHPPLTSLRVTT